MLAPRIEPPPIDWLDLFLRSSHRRQYPANTTIIHHGDMPETVYYIVDGSVSVVIEDLDGREIALDYLHAGDFFGEMGLFDTNAERSACVVVRVKNCELAEMNYDQCRRLMNDTPELLFALTSQVVSRLGKTSIKLRDMAFLNMTGRVATTLLELINMPDAITHPDGMQIKVDRPEIARFVGCSRETVGRVLKELEDRGLIHARGKTMIIYGTR